MPRIVRNQIWCAGLALVLTSVSLSGAPPQSGAGEAPVPSQITSAKKVFISNAGGGCTPFGQVRFSGDPDRAYNRFYSALKSWGRYELTQTPADADLDFEISFSCPASGTNVLKGQSIGFPIDPQFRLVLLDIKTHMMLWGITRHVEIAVLQSNRDKNFDRAMTSLVDDLKRLAL